MSSISINLLSGADLLRKGLEKGERTLPVKGVKEVTPTESWIEQKQIQATLEERKLLIGDKRIDKCGVLSQAEWDSEKKLALVTEQRGGHWTYLGHIDNKKLYIYPEETLFLMEVNCLNLKYGGAQVSLEQAYSLLFQAGNIGLQEYRVYAQLSRVGYRVLRTTIKQLQNSAEHTDMETASGENVPGVSPKPCEYEDVNKIATNPNSESGNSCEKTEVNEERNVDNAADAESIVKEDNRDETEENKSITNDDNRTTKSNGGIEANEKGQTEATSDKVDTEEKMETDDKLQNIGNAQEENIATDNKIQIKEEDGDKPDASDKIEILDEKMDTGDNHANFISKTETVNDKQNVNAKDNVKMDTDDNQDSDTTNCVKVIDVDAENNAEGYNNEDCVELINAEDKLQNTKDADIIIVTNDVPNSDEKMDTGDNLQNANFISKTETVNDKQNVNAKDNVKMETDNTQVSDTTKCVKVIDVDAENNAEGDHNEDCVELINAEDKLHNTKDADIIIVTIDVPNSEFTQTEEWKKLPIVLVQGPTLPHSENTKNTIRTKPKSAQAPSLNKLQKKPQEQSKLLKNFRCKSRVLSSLQLPDYFECIPKIVGKDTVMVAAPEEQYLPRNVFLNKTHYLLKLDDIVRKQRPTQDEEPTHCREQADPTHAPIQDNPMREHFVQQQYFQQQFFRPFLYTAPPFVQFPYLNARFRRFGFGPSNMYRNYFTFQNRFPYTYNETMQQNYNAKNANTLNEPQADKTSNNSRKIEHLNAIRRITCRLRKLSREGGQNGHYKTSLRKLIDSYNNRYRENLQLSENLALLNDCDHIDTVDLEEDEQPTGKRKRERSVPSEQDKTTHTISDKTKLLQGLTSMATRLKQLRTSGERCFRNRRSLLGAIKIYNNKFNASIYLSTDFEIKDSQQIVLDSSSDSDCVITEEQVKADRSLPKPAKRRKLSSVKECSRVAEVAPSTSQNQYSNFHNASRCAREYYNKRAEAFSKWLPSIEDWGRAEVTPAVFCHHRILNSGQEMYLYDYLNEYSGVDFKDWGQLKTEFWDALEKNSMEVDEMIPQNVNDVRKCSIEPLLGPEDCTDLATALQKVRIIKAYSATEEVTPKHKVTFDVFERDVKNFKKTDLPVPAFRIICVDERSPVPDMADIVALKKPYGDSAPMVIAVVGASVSYVQMTATELPVYIKKRFI